MQQNGEIGHSEIIGFYSDGDGDFRPNFKCDYPFIIKNIIAIEGVIYGNYFNFIFIIWCIFSIKGLVITALCLSAVFSLVLMMGLFVDISDTDKFFVC